MTTTQIIALLSSPLAPIIIGLIGSGIEKLGLAYKWPRVVAVGKALEAIAADLPKLLSNLKAIMSGGPKPPSGGEPKPKAPEVFPQTADGKPLSVRPEAGMDAEYRVWRHPAWRFAAGTGCAALLFACDPRKPPCDETKLRAIDLVFVEEVTKVCLPKYDRKEDCPEYEVLRQKHRESLRKACPQ